MASGRHASGGPPRAAPGTEETIQARSAALDGLWVSVLGEGVVANVRLPPRGKLVLGRAPDADVRIDHPSVSREHVALEVGEHGDVHLSDLGSKNGTRVLGERLVPNVAVGLAPGVLAEVGEVVLVLRPRPEPEEAVPSARPAAPGATTPFYGSAMRPVLDLIDRIAPDEIPVLVLGETGAGKELLAERLHAKSPRAPAPLLKLHCAALASSLLESELFGHERGAFTGATAAKAGLLETAHGGTVFIDEVGELSLEVQVKLLRVLEDRHVTRVGAVKGREVDVRFVAATNRDLASDVARGGFRQDLYYRLSGITVTVPPLRERRDEIPELSRRFLEQASAQRGRATPLLSEAARDKLCAHDWPGNVRELKNVVVRAVLVGSRDRIEPEDIVFAPPPRAAGAALPAQVAPPAASEPARGSAESGGERDRILRALEQSGGNQKEAAKLLGISRRTLLYRLDEHGISRPRKGR